MQGKDFYRNYTSCNGTITEGSVKIAQELAISQTLKGSARSRGLLTYHFLEVKDWIV